MYSESQWLNIAQMYFSLSNGSVKTGAGSGVAFHTPYHHGGRKKTERAHLLSRHTGLEELTSLLLPLVEVSHMAAYMQRRLGNVVPGWAGPSQPQLFTLEGAHECLRGS